MLRWAFQSDRKSDYTYSTQYEEFKVKESTARCLLHYLFDNNLYKKDLFDRTIREQHTTKTYTQ